MRNALAIFLMSVCVASAASRMEFVNATDTDLYLDKNDDPYTMVYLPKGATVSVWYPVSSTDIYDAAFNNYGTASWTANKDFRVEFTGYIALSLPVSYQVFPATDYFPSFAAGFGFALMVLGVGWKLRLAKSVGGYHE